MAVVAVDRVDGLDRALLLAGAVGSLVSQCWETGALRCTHPRDGHIGDIESWWAWRDHLDRVQDPNIATLKREADCEIARILRCCESRWEPKRPPPRLVPGRVGSGAGADGRRRPAPWPSIARRRERMFGRWSSCEPEAATAADALRKDGDAVLAGREEVMPFTSSPGGDSDNTAVTATTSIAANAHAKALQRAVDCTGERSLATTTPDALREDAECRDALRQN